MANKSDEDAPDVDRLWERLWKADDAFFNARIEFLRSTDDKSEVLRSALKRACERRAALSVLEFLPEEFRRRLLVALVEAATIQADITLARRVIASIDRSWLVQNIMHPVKHLVLHGDEWDYRRMAELLAIVDYNLYRLHIEEGQQCGDLAIREAANDFAQLTTQRVRELINWLD